MQHQSGGGGLLIGEAGYRSTEVLWTDQRTLGLRDGEERERRGRGEGEERERRGRGRGEGEETERRGKKEQPQSLKRIISSRAGHVGSLSGVDRGIGIGIGTGMGMQEG